MIRFLKMVLVVNILTLIACSSNEEKLVEWQTVKPDVFPKLTAIGQAPISLQKSDNKTQRMLLAIKASKIAAYAELAEQVYGQTVDGKTSMASLIINDQYLRTSVQGVIRGAKVKKSYAVGDSYVTELSLDFEDVYNIYNASANRREIKKVTHY